MNSIVSQLVDSCLCESDKVNRYVYTKLFPYLLVLFIFMVLSLLFSIVKIIQNAKILSLLNLNMLSTYRASGATS
jgi:hypothetical protein